MKKLLIVFALCFCSSLCASARSVVMVLNDSTKIYYALGGETNPKMTFADGIVTIEADEYAFTNIDRFYISETDDPTGINAAQTPGTVMQNGKLYVESNGRVCLYSLDGKLLQQATAEAGKAACIDMDALPQGVYVVNVNGKSVKVMKR